MLSITICHLYPELLNLYGDKGNIYALAKRLEWRGINADVRNISIGDDFIPDSYDIIFLGGGQDFEQEILKKDLIDKKGPLIREAAEAGKVFLCICGGYQIMGKSYVTSNSYEISCIGAINVNTVAGSGRMIGNLLFNASVSHELDLHGLYGQNDQHGRRDRHERHGQFTVVGFENHSGKTYLGEGVKPLGKVVKGHGNNGEDKTEGAIYKNVICSYSHGSLLPKNPLLADIILLKALLGKYKEFNPEKDFPALDDSLENSARKSVIKNILHIRPDGLLPLSRILQV